MRNLIYTILIVLLMISCGKDDNESEGIPPTKAALDTLDLHRFVDQFSVYSKAWKNYRAYEAWPNGELFYDPNINKVCQVYSAREKHVDLGNGDVFFRNKDENGIWSEPVAVATWNDDSQFSKRCHAAGICKNGDYIALVLEDDFSLSNYAQVYVYRSSNKGLTWKRQEGVALDGDIIRVSETSSVFQTKDGRLLSYASVGLANSYVDSSVKDKSAYCIYSDDNGHSWRYSIMPGGMGYLEGSFLQTDDNVIYCIARKDDRYNRECIPQMAVSRDNGDNWEYLGPTDIECVDAPVAQLLVDNYVYILCGDRWKDDNGMMELKLYILSLDEYKSMEFSGHDYSLSKIAIPKGFNFGDFSYPALVETPNNIQGMFYYTDGKQVGIYELFAKKIKIKYVN